MQLIKPSDTPKPRSRVSYDAASGFNSQNDPYINLSSVMGKSCTRNGVEIGVNAHLRKNGRVGITGIFSSVQKDLVIVGQKHPRTFGVGAARWSFILQIHVERPIPGDRIGF